MAQAIERKIKSILVVRAVLLLFLAILSVLFSAIILKQVLIKHALEAEAEYFWQQYEKDKDFPSPNTWNLKSYLIDTNKENSGMFKHLEGLDLGFTRLVEQPGYTLLYKTVKKDLQLLLIFNGENVNSLAFFLGIIPLILFLLLSYILGWLFYRKAKQVLSPISWLARKFEKFDPKESKLSNMDLNEMPSDADYEALTLANSLSDYVGRIEQFIDRERAFTRDVSHELRTPLTVINMAVEVMEADQNLSEKEQKNLSRIKRAGKDMLELVEVFLILAREADNQMEELEVSVKEVVNYQVDQSQHLLADKDITVEIDDDYELTLNSSSKILEVLLGNLIRNAFKYTHSGTVHIEIERDRVLVKDTGIGMSKQQVEQVFTPYFRAAHRPDGGHGVGLTIVKRISDRFNWPISIESTEGKGTTVIVNFSSSLLN